MAEKQGKKLALSNAPSIEAVTNQLLRLANEQQAIDWLAKLENTFITSRHQIDSKSKQRSLIMWIKGYEVNTEEKEKGYIGNFAAIAYKQANGKWTLYPTKVYVPLADHPQRKYTNNAKHPNWGHPIMRGILAKKIYKSVEAAEADMAKLHEQFPTASIPAKKKLYLMVFSRDGDRNKPISKYVFEVKVAPEGGFFIAHKLNEQKAKPADKATKQKKKAKTELLEKVKKSSNTETTEKVKDTDNPGFFASKVELSRKKRK